MIRTFFKQHEEMTAKTIALSINRFLKRVRSVSQEFMMCINVHICLVIFDGSISHRKTDLEEICIKFPITKTLNTKSTHFY